MPSQGSKAGTAANARQRLFDAFVELAIRDRKIPSAGSIGEQARVRRSYMYRLAGNQGPVEYTISGLRREAFDQINAGLKKFKDDERPLTLQEALTDAVIQISTDLFESRYFQALRAAEQHWTRLMDRGRGGIFAAFTDCVDHVAMIYGSLKINERRSLAQVAVVSVYVFALREQLDLSEIPMIVHNYVEGIVTNDDNIRRDGRRKGLVLSYPQSFDLEAVERFGPLEIETIGSV
jgi:hypothetical protein